MFSQRSIEMDCDTLQPVSLKFITQIERILLWYAQPGRWKSSLFSRIYSMFNFRNLKDRKLKGKRFVGKL